MDSPNLAQHGNSTHAMKECLKSKTGIKDGSRDLKGAEDGKSNVSFCASMAQDASSPSRRWSAFVMERVYSLRIKEKKTKLQSQEPMD